jgi:hypothetical protein
MVAVAVPPVAATPWRSWRRHPGGRRHPPAPGGADALGHEGRERHRRGGPADHHVTGRDRDPGPVVLGGRGHEGVAQERPGGVVGLHRAAVPVPGDIGGRPRHLHVRPEVVEPGGGQGGRGPAAARVAEGPPQVALGRLEVRPAPRPDQPDREGGGRGEGEGGGAVPARVAGDPLPGHVGPADGVGLEQLGLVELVARPAAGGDVLAPDRPPPPAGGHHVTLGEGAVRPQAGRQQPALDVGPVGLALGDPELQGRVHVEQVGPGGVPGDRDHEPAVGRRLHRPGGAGPLEVPDDEVRVAGAPPQAREAVGHPGGVLGLVHVEGVEGAGRVVDADPWAERPDGPRGRRQDRHEQQGKDSWDPPARAMSLTFRACT